MKYTVAVDIALPRDQVIAVLADAANLPMWLRGLESYEVVSGVPEEVGTKARFRFKMGKGSLDLIETIVGSDLPDGRVAEYETKGIWNRVADRFYEVEPGVTRWESDSEFRFFSFRMKVIGFLFGRMFRKQTRLNMEDFKAFAEHGTDVRALAGATA